MVSAGPGNTWAPTCGPRPPCPLGRASCAERPPLRRSVGPRAKTRRTRMVGLAPSARPAPPGEVRERSTADLAVARGGEAREEGQRRGRDHRLQGVRAHVSAAGENATRIRKPGRGNTLAGRSQRGRASPYGLPRPRCSNDQRGGRGHHGPSATSPAKRPRGRSRRLFARGARPAGGDTCRSTRGRVERPGLARSRRGRLPVRQTPRRPCVEPDQAGSRRAPSECSGDRNPTERSRPRAPGRPASSMRSAPP